MELQQYSMVGRGSWLVRHGPILALFILSFVSADPWLFFFGAVVFAFFYYQFLTVQTPPVILFIFFFQWFFNQGQLFLALINGRQALSTMFFPGYNISSVYYLGMIGTACFFLGVLYFYRKIPKHRFDDLRRLALRLDVDRVLFLYLLAYVVATVVGRVGYLIPALAQPLVMLMSFKWSLLILLIVAVYVHDRHKVVLVILITTDFILGFTSFWAAFKDVIYVAFIGYWIFYFRGNVLVRWTLPAIVVVMVYIGSIWTIVKQDYRQFRTGTYTNETSSFTRQTALSKLTELASSPEVDIEKGFDQLILRMSWIGAFNAVYNYVPSHVPHSDGQLWSTAVKRPLMPRMFFPEKEVLTDSQELNRYSGLNVDEKNTSISLSTIAGSYIDFGPVWMHAPLLLLGLFFGWIYRRLFVIGANLLVAHALSVPLIFLVNINEQSINRMFSSLVYYFVVVWFVCRFLQRPFLRFITTPGVPR